MTFENIAMSTKFSSKSADFCAVDNREIFVVLKAFSSLGRQQPELIEDALVKELARKYETSVSVSIARATKQN